MEAVAGSGSLLRYSSSAYLSPFSGMRTHFSASFISTSPKTTSVSFCYGASFPTLPDLSLPCPRRYPLKAGHAVHCSTHNSLHATTTPKDFLPKFDRSGRFCSPRAARELALMILYAACLDGSDPVRLFERRLNARKEVDFELDKAYLMEYNHMNFGGPPVTAETAEEAHEILRIDQRESDIEAEVLAAPLKLVYSKLILRFTRKLLVAATEKWDRNVLAIDIVAPLSWKSEPAGRILEFSILHLAMSEITVLGTRHQIVINEAVDVAKRFCDGEAPRVINGCLGSFVKEHNKTGVHQNSNNVKRSALVVRPM